MVVALRDADLVDDGAGHHGFREAQQVVLINGDLDDLELAVVLGEFLDPVHLELGLLLLGISDAVALDDYEAWLAAVVAVVLDEAALEELHVAVLGDELAVLLVEDEVLAGPVLELGVEAVAHDEHAGFLVVVDAVADVDAHEHGVLALLGRDDEVVLVLELDHPGRLVHQFARDLLHHVVHDRVQLVFVRVLEELHVVLLVLLAELRLLVAVLRLVFAALLVTKQLGDCVLPDHLYDCFLVEDVEDFEFLVEVRQKLRNQEDDDFVVAYQLVNQDFPVLVVVVVDEEVLDVAEVAALLLVALQELVFERLDVGLHLVGVKDADVVDAALAVELADLGVEELDVVVEVDGLVVREQLRRREREPLFYADDLVRDLEVFGEVEVDVVVVHVVHEAVDQLDFGLELVLGLVELQPFELAVVVDRLRQVVNLAHFDWFDLELVVLAFADYHTLFVVLQVLVLVFRELILETHFVVIDNVVVVIDIVVDI